MESVTFAVHWGAVTLLTDKGPLSTQRGPDRDPEQTGFPRTMLFESQASA